MTTRDTLLMVFFTTIGVSAKFARLEAGGRMLGVLVGCAAVCLVLHDVTGVLLARAFGVYPGYGLFAESCSIIPQCIKVLSPPRRTRTQCNGTCTRTRNDTEPPMPILENVPPRVASHPVVKTDH